MGFILLFVELYFFNRIGVEAQQRGESTKETREKSGKEQGEDPSLIKNRPLAIRDVITVSYVRKIARLAFFFLSLSSSPVSISWSKENPAR